jgi:hypothetical protein
MKMMMYAHFLNSFAAFRAHIPSPSKPLAKVGGLQTAAAPWGNSCLVAIAPHMPTTQQPAVQASTQEELRLLRT